MRIFYIALVQLLQYICLHILIEFIYCYWVTRLSLLVTGCTWPEHQSQISNWIYVGYGALISQLVMRNLISLVVYSAEGLARSSIENVLLIVSTRQHMHMNVAYYRPWDLCTMASWVHNRRSARHAGPKYGLGTGYGSQSKQ